MIHQIPELGVIAIGNQIGRVALLTLTRWELTEKDRSKIYAEPDVQEHAAFKISAILPLKSQEEKHVRPEKPLLGMAISPIQGQRKMASVNGDSTRRYRLLMTYYDHTVLSYEILRETPDGQLLVL